MALEIVPRVCPHWISHGATKEILTTTASLSFRSKTATYPTQPLGNLKPVCSTFQISRSESASCTVSPAGRVPGCAERYKADLHVVSESFETPNQDPPFSRWQGRQLVEAPSVCILRCPATASFLSSSERCQALPSTVWFAPPTVVVFQGLGSQSGQIFRCCISGVSPISSYHLASVVVPRIAGLKYARAQLRP
jgi:hypothetical protein